MREAVLYVTLGLTACFGPVPPSGAPCAPNRDCPDPLVCSPRTLTCEPGPKPVEDAPGDAVASDAPGGRDCWPLWRAGTVTLTAPTVIADVSSTDYEHDPAFAAGDLELYVARGSGDQSEIHRASRTSRLAPFVSLGRDATLNASGHDGRVAAAVGHELVVLSSTRPGGAGGEDLYQADRASVMLPFGPPSRSSLLALDQTDQQLDPELIGDGRRLYYSMITLALAPQRIWTASRTSVTEAFGGPTEVLIVGAPAVRADPAVSPDELVMAYTTISTTARGNQTDLRIARRSSSASSFEDIGPLPFNTLANEGDADFSADGCELVFASDRPSGPGSRDIWLTTVVEMP